MDRYIDVYNDYCPHQSLGFLTPNQAGVEYDFIRKCLQHLNSPKRTVQFVVGIPTTYDSASKGSPLPAFWPAAQGQQGELPQSGKRVWPGPFICPEHFESKGGAALWAAESKTKGHPYGCPFVLVEVGGVEPPSESTLTGLSPGADGYCGSLSPCSPSIRQAVTPDGRVRVIMRGRGNSYPPHGRHINDAFPGLWPLRFRRPPLIRQQ